MIERSKRKDTDLSSYANIAASSRLPKAANMNGAPRGATTLRARPGISRPYRPTVTVGPVRRQFSANMNRAVARFPAIAKGIEPLFRSGFDLHPGIWAAAELQAVLAQSVWDMYLADPNVVPVGMMPGTRIVAGQVEWYCGATGTVTSTDGDPGGVPAAKTTALNAYYWVGPNPVSKQWNQVYGFTPGEISPVSFGKRCLWHVNLAPRGWPATSPYIRVEPDTPSVGRVVDNPSLMQSPDYFEAVVSPRSLTVTEGPPPRYSREEVSKRSSPIAYGLMRALESAGDIATLARVWYDATIKQMKKETGMQVPSWSRASAETRLDVMVWGLTNGVDFQSLAEGVGQWWIGEKIGAILGPTVRAPGDSISANVRHYQVTQALRDALA